MYRFMLAHFMDDDRTKKSVSNRVKGIAAALMSKFTIPDVKEKKDTIQKVQQDSFWQ